MAPSRSAKRSPPPSSLGFGATKPGVNRNKGKKPSLSPIPVSSFQPDREEAVAAEAGAGASLKSGGGTRKPRPARAALLRASRNQLGSPMVQEDSLAWTPEQLILHLFDTDDTYGPSACGTRLERFHRAQRLGLNPPPEVEVILDEALALAAEEERKGSRANPAKLRSARLMNRPFTAAPLDVDV